jgi:5-formyltetrahydrofolate cyclo-ligase
MKKKANKKIEAANDDRAIAEYYDNQKDEDITAEVEAALNSPHTVMVPVPRSLVPQVLKLIGKKKKSA